MKKLKYFSIFAILFGLFAFACDEDVVLNGGDEEENDPIILEPPPPSSSSDSTVTVDSIS